MNPGALYRPFFHVEGIAPKEHKGLDPSYTFRMGLPPGPWSATAEVELRIYSYQDATSRIQGFI